MRKIMLDNAGKKKSRLQISKADIPVEIYIPKVNPIEKALSFLIENIKIKCKEKIKSISIIRQIYPNSNNWTDWKKCKIFLKEK